MRITTISFIRNLNSYTFLPFLLTADDSLCGRSDLFRISYAHSFSPLVFIVLHVVATCLDSTGWLIISFWNALTLCIVPHHHQAYGTD